MKKLIIDLRKVLTLLIIVSVILLLFFLLYRNLQNEKVKELFTSVIGILFYCDVFLVVYIIIYSIGIVSYKFDSNIKEKVTNEYIREITYNYSPAIASFILDENNDEKVDIRAVQLHLAVKGYLKLKGNGVYERTDKDINNLSEEHMKYVCSVSRDGKTVNEKDFNELLHIDMEKLELIKNRKINIHLTRIFNIIASLVLLNIIIVLFNKFLVYKNIVRSMVQIYGAEVIIELLICIIVIPVIIAIRSNYVKEYKRTKLAGEHAMQWKKLKNFFENYTRINEKEEKHIILLDDYIPYALALGVAGNIEDNIFKEYKEENWLFSNDINKVKKHL